MTRIRLFKTPEGRVNGFEALGHAGWATHGQDIVCSALSFLSTTCANALETVAGLHPQTETDESAGRMKVLVESRSLNPEADIIFKVFRQGIRDLESAYPKHIHIV